MFVFIPISFSPLRFGPARTDPALTSMRLDRGVYVVALKMYICNACIMV